jgi:hypothetical protein
LTGAEDGEMSDGIRGIRGHRRADNLAVVVAGTALLVAACTGGASSGGSVTAGHSAGAGRLVLDYQPSQPTGWASDQGESPTIGGHVTSRGFTFRGKKYRVSLLDLVYESSPGIKFRQTLIKAWGAHFSFRYAGGLPGGAKFVAESYNAWAGKPMANLPGTAWGGDLYVVYHPRRRGEEPAVNSDLQFIQVVGAGSFVDNAGRANPFYGEGGGLTSINGNQSVSFYDHPRLSTRANSARSEGFTAEVFLAQDTGIKDGAGKEIVNIYGGVKWGWQVQSAPGSG